MTRSAYEPLSKWLTEVLKPVEEVFTACCVMDSFQFVDKLSTFNLYDTVMASFDVRSLFTNIPVSETINTIVDQVKQNPEVFLSLIHI